MQHADITEEDLGPKPGHAAWTDVSCLDLDEDNFGLEPWLLCSADHLETESDPESNDTVERSAGHCIHAVHKLTTS
jgi:hypothetical protein